MIGEMSLPSAALWERYPAELPYLLRWERTIYYRPTGLRLADLYGAAPKSKTNIYFIQADAPHGPIKIGVATDPTQRLETLQIGCPYPLTLVASAPATVAIEHAIHRHLADYRRAGEWFEAAAPVLEMAAEFFDIGLMVEDFANEGCELDVVALGDIMRDHERGKSVAA